MKRILSSLGWAALGVLAYLFLPDLFVAAKEWPWGKIAFCTGVVVVGIFLWFALVVFCVWIGEVGNAVIRIADAIAPRKEPK